MTLFRLAIGNIKKHKKHYLIVLLLTLSVSIGVLTFLFTYETNYRLKVNEYRDNYGTWFASAEIDNEEARDILEYSKENHLNVGMVYSNGQYKEQYEIGSITDKIYGLLKIDLLEGRKPKKNNEIEVSQKLFDKENLKINQFLKVENTKYKVVGIFQTKNDFVPDIINLENKGNVKLYTDSVVILDMNAPETGMFSYEKVQGDQEGDEWYYSTIPHTINCQTNPDGTNANETMERMFYVNDIFVYVLESVLIAGFVLIALTNTSLKRRNQEFALLRGIGMTSLQLFNMVMIENIAVIVVSVILGLIGALGLTRGYFTFIHHISNFRYLISYTSMFYESLLIMGIIVFISLIPALSSSRQPLSGYFGEGKHRYFQIHYKKLKQQTKLRLAQRELSINNKMTIMYLIFSFIVMFYCVSFVYKGHLEARTFKPSYNYEFDNVFNGTTENEEVLNYIKKIDGIEIDLVNENNVEIKYGKNKINDIQISSITSNTKVITGKMPQNNHEILLNTSSYSIYLETDYKIEGDPEDFINKHRNGIDYNGKHYDNIGYCEAVENDMVVNYLEVLTEFHVGDTFEIQGEKYTITGTYFSQYDPILFLMKEEAIEKLEGTKTFYKFNKIIKTNTEYKAIKEVVKEVEKSEYSNMLSYNLSDSEFALANEVDFDQYVVDLKYVIIPIAVGILVCFILNLNDIQNNMKDYAAYQLIGMSKVDLIIKQLCKAIVLTLYNFIFMLILCFILTSSFKSDYIPILELFMIMLGYFIAFVIIYVGPSFLFVNANMLEEFKNVN